MVGLCKVRNTAMQKNVGTKLIVKINLAIRSRPFRAVMGRSPERDHVTYFEPPLSNHAAFPFRMDSPKKIASRDHPAPGWHRRVEIERTPSALAVQASNRALQSRSTVQH